MLKGRIVEVTKDAVIHRTMEYVRDAGIEIPMSPPPYAELRSFLSDLPGTSTLQVEYSFGIKIIRYDAKDGRYAIWTGIVLRSTGMELSGNQVNKNALININPSTWAHQ